MILERTTMIDEGTRTDRYEKYFKITHLYSGGFGLRSSAIITRSPYFQPVPRENVGVVFEAKIVAFCQPLP